MDKVPPPSPKHSEAQSQAAAWVSLKDRGLSADLEKDFESWMEDPENAAAFFRLEGAWDSMDRLSSLKKPDPSLDPDFEFTADRRRLWIVWGGIAAAAAVILWFAAVPRQRGSAASESSTATTAVGEQRNLNLSDGSVVQLNTDTEVTVNYTQGERRVLLDHGEAHFAVAKNAQRPFIVAAGKVAVRAVGTAFDVRIRPESVEVLVTEGKVRVDDAQQGGSLLAPGPSGSAPLLVAGQRVLIPTGPTFGASALPSILLEDEMKREMSWQKGVLNFRSTPLSEVVGEFNRYNKHKLVITDPQVGALRVGVIGLSPTDYEAFVRILEQNFGVRATPGPGATLLDKAK